MAEIKRRFIEEPANMKLLIVVSKLLTGFDAPVETIEPTPYIEQAVAPATPLTATATPTPTNATTATSQHCAITVRYSMGLNAMTSDTTYRRKVTTSGGCTRLARPLIRNAIPTP